MAVNVLKGADHPAGPAFNTVFIRDNDLLLTLLPSVNLRRTDIRAGLVRTFFTAGVWILDVDVRLVVRLVGQCSKLIFQTQRILLSARASDVSSKTTIP